MGDATLREPIAYRLHASLTCLSMLPPCNPRRKPVREALQRF